MYSMSMEAISHYICNFFFGVFLFISIFCTHSWFPFLVFVLRSVLRSKAKLMELLIQVS